MEGATQKKTLAIDTSTSSNLRCQNEAT